MKTIRRGVFETNSSTTHCASFSKDYKSISEIPFRDVSTFPKLNADNVLEIELDIYWDMEVKENDDIDLSSVETIIKYLAAHAVFSSEQTMYSRKNCEVKNNFDENHDLFLKDLQEAYTTMGLTAPTDVKYYFLDIGDNKVYVTKENLHHWFYAEGVNPWYDSKKDWLDAINKRIKKNPGAKDWPYAKKYFGLCGNDLLSNSYKSATDYYDNYLDVYDFESDSENENDDNTITTKDMLTREIDLNFYHT